MLYSKNISTEAILHNDTSIMTVYHLGQIVWQGVKSCFGSGVWRNDMPWRNDDVWKN